MDVWMHVDIDALAPAQRGVFARRIPRWVGVRLDSDNFACQAASISLARADERALDKPFLPFTNT